MFCIRQSVNNHIFITLSTFIVWKVNGLDCNIISPWPVNIVNPYLIMVSSSAMRSHFLLCIWSSVTALFMIAIVLAQWPVKTQKWNVPGHDKTCNKTCAISKDSDQTGHLGSLIRIFADLKCLRQPLGYTTMDTVETLVTLSGCIGWSLSLLVTQVLL